MATADPARSTATLRRDSEFLLRNIVLTLLVVPGLLTRGIANAACGGKFVYPTTGLQFYRLDTVNVTFQSNFSQPTLLLRCGDREQPSEKFRVEHATSSGSQLVALNISSSDPCWFHLQPQTGECGDDSPSFALWSSERPGKSRTTIGLLSTTTAAIAQSATSTTAITSPQSASASNTAKTSLPTGTVFPQADTVASSESRGGGHDLSPGAKAGIGIGIVVAVAILGAMAGFMYFRRRKKQDPDLADAIMDHERRRGRRPEKSMGRNGASSVNSGRSDEPLYPIQPVFDGFPGSTGYDDVRSLHSLRSIDTHSPPTGHSPNVSHSGGYWTERDELSAARLKSQPHSIVTSYGPNPVTPTLTPRPSSRVDLSIRAASISIDSREGIPPMPHVPLISDYSSFNVAPPLPQPAQSEPPSSPPRKPAAPIIVSYGPNRVTPTPAVTTPTVPPDESIFQRSKEPKRPSERRYSWDDSPIEQMGSSAMGPLPPYASSADFFAMEKGAIRKLAEPQAEAELPPTKDGFYHYTSDIVEHELPGAAKHNEPQLPYHPHPYKRHPEAGPSNATGTVGGSAGGGLREIDEQKFLLLPEISNLRAQKKKSRRGDVADEEEEYDLGERHR